MPITLWFLAESTHQTVLLRWQFEICTVVGRAIYQCTNTILKSDFKNAFSEWIRCLRKCVYVNVEYFKGLEWTFCAKQVWYYKSEHIIRTFKTPLIFNRFSRHRQTLFPILLRILITLYLLKTCIVPRLSGWCDHKLHIKWYNNNSNSSGYNDC